MAVAFVKHVGSVGINMTTTDQITVPAAGVAAGNTLVVRGLLDTTPITTTIADDRGNTYVERQTQAGGAFMFDAVISTALVSGDKITITLSGKASGPWLADEFSGVGSWDNRTTPATGTSTTPSSDPLTPATLGLVVGMTTNHNSRTVTVQDADTDGGSWVALTEQTTSSRTNSASYKLTTSVVQQQFNVTISSSAAWNAFLFSWRAKTAAPPIVRRASQNYILRR